MTGCQFQNNSDSDMSLTFQPRLMDLIEIGPEDKMYTVLWNIILQQFT